MAEGGKKGRMAGFFQQAGSVSSCKSVGWGSRNGFRVQVQHMTDDREQRLKQAQAIQRKLAGSGRRKPRQSRLVRTIALGTVAVAFAIYWLALEYGVDTDELVGFLGLSVLFVGGIVGLALFGGFVLWIVKKYLRSE